MVTHRRGGAARTNSAVNRVLVVVPSPGPRGSAPAGAALHSAEAVADSLRAAGFQAEIYDASGSFGTESIALHIEHSFPQVVVVVDQDATGEAVDDIVRTAREIIPGVFTAILGAQPAQSAGEKDQAADYVVGDDLERLPLLLTCLRGGQPLPAQTAGSRQNGGRPLWIAQQKELADAQKAAS